MVLDVEVTVDAAGAAVSEPEPDDTEGTTEHARADDWWPAVSALRVGGDTDAEPGPRPKRST